MSRQRDAAWAEWVAAHGLVLRGVKGRDYSLLRERQLFMYELSKVEGYDTKIEDTNPEGYTGRTYDELKNVKMPLLLDLIGRKPWTIDEIIKAMTPSMKGAAFNYARRRAAFQEDEALSLGNKAVLDAIWTDRGLAWFAGYSYERIDAAVRRGAKTSGFIKTKERTAKWRDGIQSLDESFGEGEGTLAEIVSDTPVTFERIPCGDWHDKNGRKVPADSDRKSRFIPTCTKDPKDGIYKVNGEVCDRCRGTGSLIGRMERKPVSHPVDALLEEDKTHLIIKIMVALGINTVTERQMEVIKMYLGQDDGTGKPDGIPKTPTQIAEILVRKSKQVQEEALAKELEAGRVTQAEHDERKSRIVGCGSKNFVNQTLSKVLTKFKKVQATNPEVTNLIDELLNTNNRW